MNIRRSTQVQSIVALSALVTLVGCGASPQSEAGEETGNASSALLQPSPPLPAGWATTVTNDSIITGHDTGGAPEYTCLASYKGSLSPGHMQKGWSICEVGYGGQLEILPVLRVLEATWGAAANGLYPSNAKPMAPGPNDTNTYSCRAALGASMQVGQTGGGIAGCQYPYGGRTLTASAYEVLTESVGITDKAPSYDLATVQPGAALPYNAIQGGYESNGVVIYPCVGTYGRTQIAGKTEAGWGYCDIPVGNSEVLLHGAAYYVAVPAFTSKTDSGFFVYPFVAGSDTGGAPLGVCQAPYNGTLQTGKYNLSTHECSFGEPYAGEVIAPSFTVLGMSVEVPR